MHIEFIGPAAMDAIFVDPIAALGAAGHSVRRHFDLVHGDVLSTISSATDVLVAFGSVNVSRATMEALPRLRAIISPVTGTEGFDAAAATDLGIIIANGHIVENYTSMAEATVLLILAALYDLHGTESLLRNSLPRPATHRARMLMGKTVGLIGFGQIARTVADRLRSWECKIQTTVRNPRPLPDFVSAVPLETLMATSDIVVVLSELNSASRGMLGRDEIQAMKADVVFVNVARGGIVDEDALYEFASKNIEARVALDVFNIEPLPATSPLHGLPNAILTPHMIGHTKETHERLPLVLLDNVEKAIAGFAPGFVRNPAVLPLWSARWVGAST